MDKCEILRMLEKASVSNMQVFGAACLYQYCVAKGIQNCACVVELIGHLKSVSSSENLPEWVADGAALQLNGRGDALPGEIESLLSEKDAEEFEILVECVVEIGIVDIFGASTDLPLQFARRTIEILERAEVQIPDPSVEEDFLGETGVDNAWRAAVLALTTKARTNAGLSDADVGVALEQMSKICGKYKGKGLLPMPIVNVLIDLQSSLIASGDRHRDALKSEEMSERIYRAAFDLSAIARDMTV